MSNEIQVSFVTKQTVYALIFNGASGTIWNTSGTGAFETYSTSNYGVYAVSLTNIGSVSPFYLGNFPSAITPGLYGIIARNQLGGSPSETDPSVGAGDIQWGGSSPVPLSNIASSGQISQISPIKIARGVMVQNFPFKLVSSVDHVTSFVSGIVSGQISRDGGSFGVLQSGAFSEIGLGWYNLKALTSGDLSANSVAVSFNAIGISGGASDQRDFAFVLQKVSGSV